MRNGIESKVKRTQIKRAVTKGISGMTKTEFRTIQLYIPVCSLLTLFLFSCYGCSTYQVKYCPNSDTAYLIPPVTTHGDKIIIKVAGVSKPENIEDGEIKDCSLGNDSDDFSLKIKTVVDKDDVTQNYAIIKFRSNQGNIDQCSIKTLEDDEARLTKSFARFRYDVEELENRRDGKCISPGISEVISARVAESIPSSYRSTLYYLYGVERIGERLKVDLRPGMQIRRETSVVNDFVSDSLNVSAEDFDGNTPDQVWSDLKSMGYTIPAGIDENKLTRVALINLALKDIKLLEVVDHKYYKSRYEQRLNTLTDDNAKSELKKRMDALMTKRNRGHASISDISAQNNEALKIIYPSLEKKRKLNSDRVYQIAGGGQVLYDISQGYEDGNPVLMVDEVNNLIVESAKIERDTNDQAPTRLDHYCGNAFYGSGVVDFNLRFNGKSEH